MGVEDVAYVVSVLTAFGLYKATRKWRRSHTGEDLSFLVGTVAAYVAYKLTFVYARQR